MSEQSNAELIAEVNKLLAENQWTSGWGVESLAERLAERLEAADQRAELAEANLSVEESKNAGYRAKNNQLSAVVEKVREVASSQVERSSVLLAVIREITAAPADALREVKAEARQEGAYRVYNSTLDEAEWWRSDWASENPYKAREEKR